MTDKIFTLSTINKRTKQRLAKLDSQIQQEQALIKKFTTPRFQIAISTTLDKIQESKIEARLTRGLTNKLGITFFIKGQGKISGRFKLVSSSWDWTDVRGLDSEMDSDFRSEVVQYDLFILVVLKTWIEQQIEEGR